MAMNHVALLGFASVRANLPFLRRGSNQQLARGGAGLPQRKPGALDTATAAGSEVINLGIGRGLLHTHLFPIRAQLFGKNHRQGGIDTLTHLRLSQDQRDAVIRRNAHPGVEWIRSLLFLILRLIAKCPRAQVKTNHQCRAARGALF